MKPAYIYFALLLFLIVNIDANPLPVNLRVKRQSDGIVETLIDVALEGLTKVTEIQETLENIPSISFGRK
ncbi:hypothetical protein FQR65_LT01771 [Abscondita terminalis]|nr:hypothetical protein FQR65_LT01771 [Abscondita terminalis]